MVFLTIFALESIARFILWEPYNPWQRYNEQKQVERFERESLVGSVDTSFSPTGSGDLVPNQNGIWTSKFEMPYNVTTNSVGLRNSAELKDNDDVFRILAIGDSFTFGPFVHTSETWPAWLQSLLNLEFYPDVEFEVLNAGFPGYTITDEFAYMQDKGLALEPELVVLNVTPNDVRDFLPEKRQQFARPNKADTQFLLQDEDETLTDDLRTWLENNSALFLATRILRFQAIISNFQNLLADNELAEDDFGSVVDISDNRDRLYDEYLDEYEAQLEEFVELLAENDIPLVIVYFPSVDQLMIETSPIQIVNLADKASELNTPFLDLLPIYREAGNVMTLYLFHYEPEHGFVGDGHPSRYGYYVSAEAIAKFLIDNSLVPGS